MHEVLVNRLGGLSLPRKSVVWLTDRPDMTLDGYRGCKTKQQYLKKFFIILILKYVVARRNLILICIHECIQEELTFHSNLHVCNICTAIKVKCRRICLTFCLRSYGPSPYFPTNFTKENNSVTSCFLPWLIKSS